jgi:hypothetical protein
MDWVSRAKFSSPNKKHREFLFDKGTNPDTMGHIFDREEA